ncbi:hypothetical protein [Bacillus sp. MUM 13]|uniref:hypothetical protein n=1 Tax=Bacillus sp. MUM 13 TaxID=1678001 RepID=UPI0008F5D39C|nr:hypothetical protein [Bacillus sp. MUM 13]OIK11936.1 hypothetical protein BIV59_10455 [Bacillus sp. MUM 13]
MYSPNETFMTLLQEPINSSAHEEAIHYFAEAKKTFQNLRQIIQRLSGFMILFQSQKLLKAETVAAYEFGKPLLEETLEELGNLKVPPIARSHFHALQLAAHCLQQFYQIKRDFNSKDDSSLILLEKAYTALKSTSGFSNGLNMISLDASCACGHHH